MKKILLLLLIAYSAFAGQKTWTASDSATNTNWNNANNWNASGVPETTDTVTFDASGGSKAPTVDISPSIAKLIVTSGYTRALSFASRTVTSNNGGMIFNGTGTLNTGNGLTFSGANDSLLIGAGVGTITYSSTAIIINGNCTYKIDKLFIPKSYTQAKKTQVVVSGAGAMYLGGAGILLTIGDSAKLTSSIAIFLQKTGSGNLYSFGVDDTVNGTGSINFQIDASSIAVNLPAFNYLGSGSLGISCDASSATTGSSFTQTGNISALNASTVCQIQMAKASTATYNFNGYNMSLGSTLRPGCRIAGGTLTIKYGSGTIICNSINWDFGKLGTTIDSLQTCKIITTSNVNGTATGHTFVPGTSKIIVAGTCSFASAGFTFYDVVDSIGALTFADSATILNDFTILSGNSSATTWSGYGMYVGGDFVHDGTGTINMGNSMQVPNASSLFHIGSGVGTVTATSCKIRWGGASGTFDVDKATAFLEWAGAGSATFTGSATVSFVNSGATIPLASGTVLPANFEINSTNVTLRSATLNVPSSLTLAAQTFDAGTSIVRATGTGTWTSAGKKFWQWRNVGSASTKVTLADSLQADSSVVDSSGKLTCLVGSIRTRWMKIASPDSFAISKPIIVRDSIVWCVGSKPISMAGSQVESVAGQTLTVKLNGLTTTPRVINRGGKIRWR